VIGRTVELQAKRRDGNEFPMELSLATGQTADGMFFTGILRDITERKQVEVAMERQAAELERVNEDLSGANKIMKDFLSTTSHELRTPLASILAFASTMRDRWGSLDEEQQLHFLEVIHRQTRRVARLVDHLLAVSRIEAGAVESRLAPLDPMEVIRQTLAELEPATSEIRVEGLAGLEVMADPDHLKQIMLNYVGNALKYGAPPIVVEASERDGWVEIRVRDAGSGVPETFVPRLFEKFARAGGTQDVDGTGLGLSIVRGLARAQGGEAWYEPNAPQGSCFAVRLPGVKQ